MTRSMRIAISALLLIAALPGASLAQSKKVRKRPTPGTAAAPGSVDPSINSSRRVLSTWLDDANTPDQGGGSVEMGWSRWNTIGGAETDLPWVDFGYGVTDRLQLGASASFAHASYTGGSGTSGLGDAYIQSKYQILDPDYSFLGLAISPLVEILGNAVAKDPALRVSRVNYALPVTLHHAFENGAVYGTVTYFSRGVASAGIEAERTLSDRVTIAGLVAYAYATRVYFQGTSGSVVRSRTDVAGEIYYSLNDAVTVAGNIGRTVSRSNLNAATLSASVSVKIEWKHVSK